MSYKTFKKGILRVSVLNNFNFTAKEFKQLKKYTKEWFVFVNSNSYPVIRGPYPSMITINPDLTKFIEPKGDISKIRAVRIKYVSDSIDLVKQAFSESVNWAKSHNINIIITFMRFRSKHDLEKYTINQDNYEWKKQYYRQIKLKQWSNSLFHYCDLNEIGCPGCKNCAKLMYGYDTDAIFGINLSSSGLCQYNCPSCYAKYVHKYRKVKFDVITQNAKQKGYK